MDDPAEPATGDAEDRRPWGAVTGVVALAYVLAVVVDRLLLVGDGARYTDLHRQLDAGPARAVLAVVALAVVFHGLDGVRRLLGPPAPADARWRAVVAFGTWATGVPLAVVILWPVLDGSRP